MAPHFLYLALGNDELRCAYCGATQSVDIPWRSILLLIWRMGIGSPKVACPVRNRKPPTDQIAEVLLLTQEGMVVVFDGRGRQVRFSVDGLPLQGRAREVVPHIRQALAAQPDRVAFFFDDQEDEIPAAFWYERATYSRSSTVEINKPRAELQPWPTDTKKDA